MQQDGKLDYIEMSATDGSLDSVKSFYSAAFGWRFQDYGPAYSAFDEGLDGGFQTESPEKPLPILFSVDLEQTLAKVEEAGGRIVRPIYDFPGGRRFHFTDPAGNELAVWAKVDREFMGWRGWSEMHKGSCHCGAATFRVESDFSEGIECNCSHCSRKGYLLWFVPRAALKLDGPLEALSTYHFNKHVIDHHFCPACGCAPFGLGVSPDGQPTAAINIRCLEDVDLTAVRRVPVDGRSF